jgi:UDP-N-acetyl-D-glucosamine/UDP-N-acetyl-D-galactosamine dehydrogenase
MSDAVVAVVGLGYVGLPLALGFGERLTTYGYDRSGSKVRAYQAGNFAAAEVQIQSRRAPAKLTFTDSPECLRRADYIIVAVPTPVDDARKPDLEPLVSASAAIGKHLRRGATVIYESTVYPGATEEVCIPEIERASGFKWRTDFHVGYSPERINPGDRERTLRNTIKVVAGDDPSTLERICGLYGHVVEARLHRVSSIRVAEAAKVIENTQRDLNIALVNELSIIFDRLGLDTLEVLEAAGTKWNFLPFRPGLVGGHCIGVDPYYLTHKAEMTGYHPQVILAGRRINDSMAKFVAESTVKCLVRAGRRVSGAHVNVLGLAFKEDCADIRNSKVADFIEELKEYGIETFVHDPLANADEAQQHYGIRLREWDELPAADALVVAVAHRSYVSAPLERLRSKIAPQGCFIDVKSRFDAHALKSAGITVWRL